MKHYLKIGLLVVTVSTFVLVSSCGKDNPYEGKLDKTKQPIFPYDLSEIYVLSDSTAKAVYKELTEGDKT